MFRRSCQYFDNQGFPIRKEPQKILSLEDALRV